MSFFRFTTPTGPAVRVTCDATNFPRSRYCARRSPILGDVATAQEWANFSGWETTGQRHRCPKHRKDAA